MKKLLYKFLIFTLLISCGSDDSKPLSGLGKIKLGEAYLQNKQFEKADKLIKDGWITADLSKGELR